MQPIPKNKPWQSKKYKTWIESLPCVVRGYEGVVAHHVISCGLGGSMGAKKGDDFLIPLNPIEHALLHHDTKKWEEKNGKQIDFLWYIHSLETGIKLRQETIK